MATTKQKANFAELGAARADKKIFKDTLNEWFLPIMRDMKANHNSEYFQKKVVIAVDGYNPILITYRDFLMMVISAEKSLVSEINYLLKQQQKIRDAWDTVDLEQYKADNAEDEKNWEDGNE